MANKFARANGDFNNAAIWSLSATGLSATTVPTIGDNAIANTFTIQITGNVACDNIVNGGTPYGGSSNGIFNLNNGSQLAANISGWSNTNVCVSVSGTNNSTIIGNVSHQGGGMSVINNSGTGTLTVIGNLAGAFGNTSQGSAITNTSTGNVVVYGTVNGPTVAALAAITNTSTGSVSAYGSFIGGGNPAIGNSSTGSVTVVGNVIGDSRGGAGITSSNAAANVRISGNLIGAPNGIPAVYAASYTVNPVPSEAYTRHANNGTGVGSDAYLYYYTTDALSTFSVPPVSAVRAGVQYANNTLTGTCEIPPVSSVTFGVPVDNTTGTAVLTSNNLFEVSVASLTATDSLGARLKNSATVESVGRIIASF